MNIFAIEQDSAGNVDWSRSALSHDNFRVNKMIIESCQMLSTNAQLFGESTRYRMSFQNHPSTIWARSSSANFRSLVTLATALRNEFCRRYSRQSHGCDDVLDQMQNLINTNKFKFLFPRHNPTPLPLCMPDEYKTNNIVASYRNYFANKPNLRYFSEDVPDWVYKYRMVDTPIILQDKK